MNIATKRHIRAAYVSVHEIVSKVFTEGLLPAMALRSRRKFSRIITSIRHANAYYHVAKQRDRNMFRKSHSRYAYLRTDSLF